MNARGVADTLPGAARRRGADPRLRRGRPAPSSTSGDVHYARDAFEGLRLMDRVMTAKRGGAPVVDARKRAAARRPPSARPATSGRSASPPHARPPRPRVEVPVRSDVATDVAVPTAPFFGTRVVKGIALADYAALLDERATVPRPVGAARRPRRRAARRTRSWSRPRAGPRLRYWLDRLATDRCSRRPSCTGTSRAVSEGNDLVVLDETTARARERSRFTFPRQRRDRRLCIADFFRPREWRPNAASRRDRRSSWSRSASRSASTPRSCSPRTPTATTSRCTAVGVQLTEALAEYWHRRVREELVLPDGATGRPRTRPTSTAVFSTATAAAGTRSATAPARTWRTGRRWSTCCDPSGSA